MHFSKPWYQNGCILLINLIILLSSPLLICLFFQPGYSGDLQQQKHCKNWTQPAEHLPILAILLLTTGGHCQPHEDLPEVVRVSGVRPQSVLDEFGGVGRDATETVLLAVRD